MNKIVISGTNLIEKNKVNLVLPEGSISLIFIDEGKFKTNFKEIVRYLIKDRNLTIESIFNNYILYNFKEERIIIPIFDEPQINNLNFIGYVSRAVWWKKSKTDSIRYKYPKGFSISNHIFNLSKNVSSCLAKIIVENTFNSIWLNQIPNMVCYSTFGSHLSDIQSKKLSRVLTKEDKLYFLWDYGAEEKAEKASYKLKKLGINSKLITMTKEKPQPDDWTEEELIEKISICG